MSNDLTTSVQRLLKSAASLPATTGESEKFQRRFGSAGTATVIIADTSASMSEEAGARRKIDHLREALAQAWQAGTVLISFSSTPAECDSPAALPAPSGGTALHLAMAAAGARQPRHTLVISDGQPDDPAAALAAAHNAVPGVIDVIYCGPDSDAAAIAFMRSLARAGGGRVVIHDLQRRASAPALAHEVRALTWRKC